MADLLAVAPTKLSADDVKALIRSHFGAGGDQYSVLFEVRNATAFAANRSVDAVVMSLWPSLGMELWGMEIKVDRRDWLRERRDPSKASAVYDYFDRWFLVAPGDVAKHEELPPTWGWLLPEDGRLREARPGARNDHIAPVDRNFLGALLRRVGKVDDAFVDAATSAALAEQQRRHEAEIDKRAMERLGDLRDAAEQWEKLRKLLRRHPADFIWRDDVIHAVSIIVRAGVLGTYRGLSHLIDEIDHIKASLDSVRSDLKLPKGKRRKR